MKEKESISTEPKENKTLLTRTLGYAHRLREEAGLYLSAAKERVVLGCGGILEGLCLSGLGGYVISRGLGYSEFPWNALGLVAGGTAILSGVAAIVLSCDSEKSSY